ncbi:hypothetical protein C8Q80DRAFT_1124585 [Daedaleopsis nitida]|nr:hypothetical protein C8Q80DRAFT_1124585 [Daedaleopsis nitida]
MKLQTNSSLQLASLIATQSPRLLYGKLGSPVTGVDMVLGAKNNILKDRQHKPGALCHHYSAFGSRSSTKVHWCAPTVLQFSARVPPGANATPLILRDLEPGTEQPHRITKDDADDVEHRMLLDQPKSILISKIPASAARKRTRSLSPQGILRPTTMEQSDVPITPVTQGAKAPRRITRSNSRAQLNRSNEELAERVAEERIILKREHQVIRGNSKHDRTREQRSWMSLLINLRSFIQAVAFKSLWLRVHDEEIEEDVWIDVEVGHKRSDGRRLTITPRNRSLSWSDDGLGARPPKQ